MLFAETAAERSRQTGVERTVVADKARRFVIQGMLGLVDQRGGAAGRKGHTYPEAVAAYILTVTQLYPPIHLRELVRILQRKFGYRTNHHTLQRFLAHHTLPVQLDLGLTPFHDFADAYQARWTVVRMAYEGWNKQSIAGCLKLSRRHVHTLLKAFDQDGFASLEDQRTRAPHHPDTQLTLQFLAEVLELQKAYPRAGRFRLRGLLERQRETPPPSDATIGRAMAINRRLHGVPGPWTRAPEAAEAAPSTKHLPYRPLYRHHLWFIDLRYLVKLAGQWVYSLCILEGYSRTILAGMATQQQDLPAVLHLLFAALGAYGAPQSLVSDNGSVFRAKDYQALLQAVDTTPLYIEQGKPWQNLIEAQFKVQLRLADFTFEQARSFAEIQDRHAAFLETFNTTRHWAHQQRDDGCYTPVTVLGDARGRPVDLAPLRRLVGQGQWLRTVTPAGYVQLHRFYLYAEAGLARRRVALWLYDGHLHIDYEHTRLAQYQCRYDRQAKQLQEVTEPHLFATPFASPQLELLELDDTQWRKILHRPLLASASRARSIGPEQLLLLEAVYKAGRVKYDDDVFSCEGGSLCHILAMSMIMSGWK